MTASLLRRQIDLLVMTQEGQALGELDPTVDVAQLAFEIQALGIGANWAFQWVDDA